MGSEWYQTRFGDLCDITRGGSPRPIHDYLREEGVPWVKIADATASSSRFIKKTSQFIKPEGLSKTREVFPGDLIVSNSATPGIPRFMDIYAAVHDGWLLLRNFKGLDKEFCFYLIEHERPKLLLQGNGSVFTNLKTDILKNHIVKLPAISEQRSIADILGTLDDKIELNRQMNEMLEAMAQALFKSWFVDFDPVIDNALAAGNEIPEPLQKRAAARQALSDQRKPLPADIQSLFPDSFVFTDEMGWVPEGWPASTVGEEFDVTMGQSPPGDTYNENGIGIPFFQGRADFGFRYPSNRVFCTTPKRYATKGDTLVSVRAPVGDANIAAEDCAIGRGVAALKHKSGSRSYTYYSMLQLAEHFKIYEGEGTVFGSINQKDFKTLPAKHIPTDVLSEFHKIANEFDSKVESNSEQLAVTIRIRDVLLPKLLSGELRIPDAEKQVAEAV